MAHAIIIQIRLCFFILSCIIPTSPSLIQLLVHIPSTAFLNWLDLRNAVFSSIVAENKVELFSRRCTSNMFIKTDCISFYIINGIRLNHFYIFHLCCLPFLSIKIASFAKCAIGKSDKESE